jgi:hypothetical protein
MSVEVDDAGLVGATELEPGRPATNSPQSSRPARWMASPWFLGGLLALLGTNVSTARPAWGIDSSFRVGLTEAVRNGMQFGVDVVWPYGPLGFLGGPTYLDRGLLALAVVFQLAVLTVLFTSLVVHLERLGISRTWSGAVLVCWAFAISVTDNIVPELAAITVVVVLVTWWHDRSDMPSPSDWWVIALAGSVAGALVLVKVGPGAVACGAVVVFAISTDRRSRLGPVAIAAIAAGFLVCWFATGQAASSLSPFFSTSRELSSGYQDAQAVGPDGGRVKVIGALTVVSVVVAAFGVHRWVRRQRRAWWAVVPIAAAVWFELKQGLVRWDNWHTAGAFLLVALLIASIDWDRRSALVPLSILAVSAVAAVGIEPSRLRSTWSDRLDVAQVLMINGRQDREIDEARAEIRASYDVPAPVIDALASGTVHAEEWDINAVWGYGLDWEPLPVLQSYSTYTAELDRINAEHYAATDGPDGVLLHPATVDFRYGPWESPAARVALTCNFVHVTTAGDWTALRRAADACGTARELLTVRVAPNETIDVPEPSSPDALVVAHFDLPGDAIGSVVTALARPLRYAHVTLDGTRYRLVLGTAENAHLVSSPGLVGDRELPHGRIATTTMSFDNVGSGDIIVRFEEIPLAER